VADNGRERTKHIHARNWTEARREHEARKPKVREGREPLSSKTTMDDVAEDFFQMYEGMVLAGERTARTLEKHRGHYRVHLKPYFGARRVQATTQAHVSHWLAEKRRQALDVHSLYATLSTLFNHALSRGLILESPLKQLSKGERPKAAPKSAPRCLNDEECSALIARALPSTRTLIALYAYTGLRQSEGLGLTWADLDLENGTLRVEKQLARKKCGEPASRVAPKTKNGVREVDLLPELVALLKRHKAEEDSLGPRTMFSLRPREGRSTTAT
jgi:integrase